jgi:hypothetical protein
MAKRPLAVLVAKTRITSGPVCLASTLNAMTLESMVTKYRAMLPPRLSMLMKGTAWAQVKGLDAEKLMDSANGIKTLLSAISTWEEAEELQSMRNLKESCTRLRNILMKLHRAT